RLAVFLRLFVGVSFSVVFVDFLEDVVGSLGRSLLSLGNSIGRSPPLRVSLMDFFGVDQSRDLASEFLESFLLETVLVENVLTAQNCEQLLQVRQNRV